MATKNQYSPVGHTEGEPWGEVGQAGLLTFLESEILHPSHTDGLVDRGDVCLVNAGGYLIAGVAQTSASAATDLITIDTEGKYFLTVDAADDAGNAAITLGAPIYVNTSDCSLSLAKNDAVQHEFGYALSTLSSGETDLVTVLVRGFSVDFSRIKVGTEASPFSSSVADTKFWELRTKSTATSGDARSLYAAMTFGGAGGAGEAVRARSIVEAAVAGGVHGLHGGVEIGTGGSITGLAAGVRGTFIAPDAAANGTVCGGMSELWAGGASTNWAGATHSIHRFVNAGGAGKSTAVNVFEFVGLSASQFLAATNAVIDHALRILVDGVAYYIGVYDAPTGS
jgi:hypothetical protein